MRRLFILILVITVSSCGYHLRSANSLAQNYPLIKIDISAQSLLKRPLVQALLASGVKLADKNSETASHLVITKDSLSKIIQSVGVNNQVQEYRLEYDVEYRIADGEIRELHLEQDYSFDVQQISGGQQEEQTLRKQLAEDMAWAIIRQINADSETQ